MKRADLVKKFVEAAANHGNSSSLAEAKKFDGLIREAAGEISLLGESAREIFSYIANYEMESAQLWASTFLLQFDEVEARASLERLEAQAKEPDTRIGAGMTLDL